MYLISAGYAAATGEAGEATPAAAPFSLGVFLAQVIPPLAGLGLVATFGRGTLETVGVRWGRAGPGLVYGAVGFMAAFPVCILALLASALVLVRLLPSFQPEPPAILKTVQETRQFWVLGLALLQAGILAPLGEELTYRGILMVSLMKSLGAGGAILASALLFGLAHIGAQPQAVLPLFLLGLVLGYAAYRTRSLLAPVVAHALFNSVMVVGTYFKGV
jgi:membrane protease YdiL (CAAX protease family)